MKIIMNKKLANKVYKDKVFSLFALLIQINLTVQFNLDDLLKLKTQGNLDEQLTNPKTL
jgi:hypothetical protein